MHRGYAVKRICNWEVYYFRRKKELKDKPNGPEFECCDEEYMGLLFYKKEKRIGWKGTVLPTDWPLLPKGLTHWFNKFWCIILLQVWDWLWLRNLIIN